MMASKCSFGKLLHSFATRLQILERTTSVLQARIEFNEKKLLQTSSPAPLHGNRKRGRTCVCEGIHLMKDG